MISNEIEKIVDELSSGSSYYVTATMDGEEAKVDPEWLRRRLRVLVRKAYWTGVPPAREQDEYDSEEAFKERFGCKP